jgi:hypothetical protein
VTYNADWRRNLSTDFVSTGSTFGAFRRLEVSRRPVRHHQGRADADAPTEGAGLRRTGDKGE